MNQLKDEELVVVISICNMILTQILLFDLLHSEMNIVVGKEFSCKLLYLYYSEVKFARFLFLLYVFFFQKANASMFNFEHSLDIFNQHNCILGSRIR